MEEEKDGRKDTPSWLVEIESLLKEDGVADPAAEAAVWRKHSIYRVPAHVKNGKHTSPYGPQLVSLGPFHRDDPALAPMEEHKRRALLHLLRRTGAAARELVAALETVAERLEDAYMDLQDDEERWRGREAFLQVMVTDWCFLLEVIRAAEAGGALCDYAPNDPIFSRHGELYMFPYVRRDMLMMENQLPLLVLQRLVAVVSGPDAATDDAINNMVLQFVSLTPDPPELHGGGLALHPIDVCHCHRSLLHAADTAEEREIRAACACAAPGPPAPVSPQSTASISPLPFFPAVVRARGRARCRGGSGIQGERGRRHAAERNRWG